jgi:hypothetical protein
MVHNLHFSKNQLKFTKIYFWLQRPQIKEKNNYWKHKTIKNSNCVFILEDNCNIKVLGQRLCLRNMFIFTEYNNSKTWS